MSQPISPSSVPFSSLSQSDQAAIIDRWIIRDAAILQAQRDAVAAQVDQALAQARIDSYRRPA